jgi:hypothetical protein
MAVPPIHYRATDYPPQYRPVGYWRHARRQTEPDGTPTPDRRRRWWALVAVALATLVLHAGIAAAYLGDDSGGTTSRQRKSDAAAQCDAGRGQPSDTVPPTATEEIPEPAPGDPTGGGTADSATANGSNRRGAL